MSKMKLGQLLGEYFDSTTIHGISYIHGREHWASRMLWVYYLFMFKYRIIIPNISKY